MKILVLGFLMAVSCQTLVSIIKWIVDVKELIDSKEYMLFNEYVEDLEEMLGSNTSLNMCMED